MKSLSELVPELEQHEYGKMFPTMSESEFNDLVEDIRKNGLEDKIVMLDGMVLDGWHRYLALLALGIDPKPYFIEYDGKDPLAYVVSKNKHRRHLDKSQWAMIAAKIATARQGERTDLQPSVNLPKVTQSDAAKSVNVSTSLVGQAKAVLDSGNAELIEAVGTGKKSASNGQ